MKIKEKITVKNYKCFDSSGGGFECILPINVIIGKNNSGKSSLIDLVQFLVQKHKAFIDTGRDNLRPEVFIEHRLTEHEISTVFQKTYSGGGLPGQNHFEYGKNFIDNIYTYQLGESGKKIFKALDVKYNSEASKFIEQLTNPIQSPFSDKTFCNITAERDVVPEPTMSDIILAPNGVGATNLVQQIINRTNRDSRLIEIELLKELNLIINPDIEFSRILVQLDGNNHWELFFEDSNEKRIALSKMGSGIKTVLIVLLNLIIRPVIESKNRNSYIFAFEELENNLHPSLQRRLYNYIRKYSEKHSSYFFLTTHSNVVIDAFGLYENAQMIHVINDGKRSISNTVLSFSNTKHILNDLGLKASDILQSNGIIWVEGPSDRNFVNKWIEIVDSNLKEGLHYSIMFYGGRLLSNLTFDYSWFNRDIIPLFKINKNSFIIMDRDGKTDNSKLNDTKERINLEVGHNNCWVTKGREIENYLTDADVSKWLMEKLTIKPNFKNDKNCKIEDNILKSDTRIKLKYNLNKTIYSSEITKYLNQDSLDILDLKVNLKRLIDAIKDWNSI